MSDFIINILLVGAVLSEAVYILFRSPVFTKIPLIIYPVAVIFSLYQYFLHRGMFDICTITSLAVLLAAKKFLVTPPYEKPDYRYLIILAGVLLMRLM